MGRDNERTGRVACSTSKEATSLSFVVFEGEIRVEAMQVRQRVDWGLELAEEIGLPL
jgi:hypothetical protein